ncbi:MAG: type II secretion system protein GspM [bacterium]
MNASKYKRLMWAVMIIICCIAVIYVMILLPYSLNSQITDQLDLEYQKMEMDRKLIAQRAQKLKQLEQLKKLKESYYNLLMASAKVPVVAAKLQGVLKNMAEEEGVKIIREKQLDQIEHGIFLEIPVQFTIEGTITKVSNFIYRIEDHTKFLDISDLNIKVRNIRNPTLVNADITISGFIIAGPAVEEG